MGAETYELQDGVVGFSVNQHQIRLYVAIPMVYPVARQGMVAVFRVQWLVGRQRPDNYNKIILKNFAVRSFGFPLQVALELAGLLNCPHQAPFASPSG